ncbi:MAG: hypothetical protein DHS20C03_04850 [Minwuia thermotolerans]|nr:MAG: hypothetical protein DHS20C03_04850 [Minwuia thermotolerans]
MTAMADPYFERFRHVRERLKNVGYKFNFEGLQHPRFAFPNKDLTGANFSRSSLFGADFSGCDLTGASFAMAKLVRCDFSGAILDRVDFSEADLTGALLKGATLYAANFERADLTSANLKEASVDSVIWTDAVLKGARFLGVDLRREDSLQGWQLLEARGLDRKLMPNWLYEDFQSAKKRVDAAMNKPPLQFE